MYTSWKLPRNNESHWALKVMAYWIDIYFLFCYSGLTNQLIDSRSLCSYNLLLFLLWLLTRQVGLVLFHIIVRNKLGTKIICDSMSFLEFIPKRVEVNIASNEFQHICIYYKYIYDDFIAILYIIILKNS